MPRGKFVITTTPTGAFRFNLVAANGQSIATSENYSSLASCKNGIESVIKNAPIAYYEDQSAEEYAKTVNPKFELYSDKSGEYRFRLKARNGEIIAVSEGYKSKQSCENGIDSVRKNAPEADVISG
ncbi:MAG: YegP family protein [Acetanaerobacterium sp.]